MLNIEQLEFRHAGSHAPAAFEPVLVGVVSSGNLEVLLERVGGSEFTVRIETAARGFGAIWEAVIADFHERHGLAGVAVAIHDMGATPAVVMLRLEQAVSGLEGTSS